MVDVIDIEANFFEVNPQFKTVKGFKDLNRKKESDLAWFVVYFADKSSPYKNMHSEDRILSICAEVFEDDDFFENNKEKLLDLIETYLNLSETPAEKHLKVWEKKIHEKNKFLETITYNLENYKDIDEMLKNNKQTYEVFNKIKRQLEDEKESRVRGDSELSFIEGMRDEKKK